jgi:quercetin dioxygenase-like cupin family protein
MDQQVTPPASVAEMVAYQDGSIVSRQVIKRPAGNVTLFAFDAGQELTEHTSPFDALVQVVEGEARIELARQPFTVAAGQILLMPANIPHALKAEQRFKMLLTMIRS